MRISALILPLLLAVVVGCGAGGDGDDAEPATPTPTAALTAFSSPTPSPSPTSMASPFPEVVLAVGRSFARGDEALLLRNDGSGWESVAFGRPALTLLRGVVFSEPEVAWAFGFLGDLETALLLRSDDGGRSWRDVSAQLGAHVPGIFDLAFSDAQRGTLVARRTFGGPVTVATQDGGGTWPDGGPVPSTPMGGTYGIATRDDATEVLVRDAAGLSVFRADRPDLTPIVLTSGSQAQGPEHNAIATADSHAWVATTVIESLATPSVAGIFASAAPGEPWVRQPVASHVFAEIAAIDVRDVASGLAGGRGIVSSPSRTGPVILTMGGEDPTWDMVATPSRPGASLNTRVVDVVRLRGDAAWAITTDFDPETGRDASAFLRSDDAGKSWSYVPTPFEDRVRLTDLARNTTISH